MKAVYFNQTGTIDQVQFGEIPQDLPSPGVGECRIRCLAGALNHLDLWVLKGLPILKYQFPHVMGADLCGEIVETCSEHFRVGDKVLVYPASFESRASYQELATTHKSFGVRGESAPGVFREEILIQDRFLVHAPSHLTSTQAAALPLAYLTAWQMIVSRAGIFPGASDLSQRGPFLIHGAGSGVSRAIVQLLGSFGFPPEKIVLTSRRESVLDELRLEGLIGVLAGPDMESHLKVEVPTRFDVIFDHVGAVYWPMNFRLLKNAGSLVTCGASSGFEASVDLRQIFFRQLRVLGSTMGELEDFRSVLQWISARHLEPVVSKKFAFEQIREALQFLDSGNQSGKIVCEM